MTWLLLLAIAQAAVHRSGEITDIPQIGPHYRILVLDKSENPQNLLAIYTKLNDECKVEDAAHPTPTLGFYWLMDRERYKPLNGMIRRGISDRIELAPLRSTKSFAIKLNELKELNTDIKSPEIIVTAKGSNGECGINADITLGPSDKDRTIRLTGLHSESSKIWYPPFRRVNSITLTGADVATGEMVRRTYSAKP